MKFEYIYMENNVINVLQVKQSQNKKIGIGLILQTYHFSIEQIKEVDIKKDKKNCLDCPLSYSKQGGCYTHKGMQLMGLKSMLKRLNRLYLSDDIIEFKQGTFDRFFASIHNKGIRLVRFGAYGEPVFLGETIVSKLASLSNHTGYTHQFFKSKYNWSKDYFMASVHTIKGVYLAKKWGFRSFIAKPKEVNFYGVNCPASKEAETDLTCIKCGLCNGKKTGIKKDVFINVH